MNWLLALLLFGGVGNFILEEGEQFILFSSGGGGGSAAVGEGFFGSETTTTCSALTSSFVDVGTVTPQTRMIIIQNTCNEPIVLSDDGSSDGLTLLAGVGGLWKFTDEHYDDVEPNRDIYVKHDGTAPTSGTLIITVLQ